MLVVELGYGTDVFNASSGADALDSDQVQGVAARPWNVPRRAIWTNILSGY
jgi:hypothetical protein